MAVEESVKIDVYVPDEQKDLMEIFKVSEQNVAGGEATFTTGINYRPAYLLFTSDQAIEGDITTASTRPVPFFSASDVGTYLEMTAEDYTDNADTKEEIIGKSSNSSMKAIIFTRDVVYG